MNHKGSCLCKKMQYETGELSTELDHCHCTFCQKSHGAAFGTYAKVMDENSFKWISGGDDVGRRRRDPHAQQQGGEHEQNTGDPQNAPRSRRDDGAEGNHQTGLGQRRDDHPRTNAGDGDGGRVLARRDQGVEEFRGCHARVLAGP